ncbi:MAG: hypothetical protein HZA35_03400 [Parcubacteria group bacterium]|nr:hypothetical protein [Parcubacteria group bacterium]
MKKYSVSFLVISTFIVYVIYQHLSGTENTIIINPSVAGATRVISDDDETISREVVGTSMPVVVSSQNPIVTKPAPMPMGMMRRGLYKDGQYTGVSVDAYCCAT